MITQGEKKLFLLDSYALIYRAYFAFIKNPRINSKGLDTSAVYGYLNSLLELIREEKPTHIATVFDLKGPTFRHEKYPEYKANRDAMPEGIRDAIKYKTPKEAPFPAGFLNDSKVIKEDLSSSSDQNEKEISSEVEGAEVDN